MSFHWISFLLGIAATLGGIVAFVLLVDHRQRQRVRHHAAAVEAWRTLAWEVLGRLGKAHLTSLNEYEGYLDLVLEPDGTTRDLTEAEIKAIQTSHPRDRAAAPAHLRLAFHEAAAAAMRDAPRRRLKSARYGLRDGRLLVSLYLPAPKTMERHSVWIGRLDGTDGRRAVFGNHPDDP